jgi:hypothetical protein
MHQHVVPVKERMLLIILPSILSLRLNKMLRNRVVASTVDIVILKVGFCEGVLVVVARSQGLVGGLDGTHVA